MSCVRARVATRVPARPKKAADVICHRRPQETQRQAQVSESR